MLDRIRFRRWWQPPHPAEQHPEETPHLSRIIL